MDTDNLVNILDSFTVPPVFSPDEEITLIETAFSLINDLLESDPMLYVQPLFHECVILEVTDLLLQQVSDVIPYDTEDELEFCVEQAMKLFYKKVAPKRSFQKSFIRVKPNIAKLRAKIIYLENIPQPEQRTPEWYNFRYKYLTASSIWKAFISKSTRNQLIYDKCKPLNIAKYSHTSMDSPMHWGHKYEPVSIQLYEALYNTNVSDFGCIPHATLEFLAASPDGINTLESSERYGRMLEIKNIVNREIDGNPKIEYWIQMQLQMEVCNLNECDFLETRFKEYIDEDAYLADSYQDEGFVNYNKTREDQQKGMMIQFIVNGQPVYEYAPLNVSKVALTAWETAMMDKHHNDMWCKNIYWWLDELSCVLVLRNKFWFKAAIPILTDVWKTIEHEKAHGYDHRSPNKKVKIDSVPNVLGGKCLIDLSTMMDMDMDVDVVMDMDMDVDMNDETHRSKEHELTVQTEVFV